MREGLWPSRGPGVLHVAIVKHSDLKQLRGGKALFGLQVKVTVHH